MKSALSQVAMSYQVSLCVEVEFSLRLLDMQLHISLYRVFSSSYEPEW